MDDEMGGDYTQHGRVTNAMYSVNLRQDVSADGRTILKLAKNVGEIKVH
jgi:hypothetical protein